MILNKTHQYLACTAEQLPATLKTVQKLYEIDDSATWKHCMMDVVTDEYSTRPSGTKDLVCILVDDHHMADISAPADGQTLPPMYVAANHVIFVTEAIDSLPKAVPRFDNTNTKESTMAHSTRPTGRSRVCKQRVRVSLPPPLSACLCMFTYILIYTLLPRFLPFPQIYLVLFASLQAQCWNESSARSIK
jgi:hypothetical protein